jgi:hypothetical protein
MPKDLREAVRHHWTGNYAHDREIILALDLHDDPEEVERLYRQECARRYELGRPLRALSAPDRRLG